MPREIEFRAWDKPRKLMFHNVENTYDALECVIEREGLEDEVIWSRSFGELLKSGAYEIMQYTGLKDSKGVKVFEGDLVKIHNFKPNLDWEPPGIDLTIFKVIWNKCVFNFRNEYISMLFSEYDLHSLEPWDFEVIGNIYQNLELLPELSTTRGEECIKKDY